MNSISTSKQNEMGKRMRKCFSTENQWKTSRINLIYLRQSLEFVDRVYQRQKIDVVEPKHAAL